MVTGDGVEVDGAAGGGLPHRTAEVLGGGFEKLQNEGFEMLRHPRVKKQLQNEVKRISNEKTKTSHITEADLNKMQYHKLVIKESL